MTVRIFPYVLTRYSAMPFKALENWQLFGLDEHTAAVARLQAQIQQQIDKVCGHLYESISAAQDHKVRQNLLQLKRVIYNGKIPSAAALAQISDDVLMEQLRYCIQLLAEQQELDAAWRRNFTQQLNAHRRQLQIWTKEERLRSGILLSSPVLYGQLDSFAAASPDAFRSRELKNEYSLIRYITRMAAKTSPFSTFTYTGISLLAPDATHSLAPESIVSNIRLHNGLFAYLRSLMIHHPEMNGVLEVRLNVTAAIQGEQLAFLVNYFNIEAFQRLPARNVALWLFHYFQEQQAPVTLDRLIIILSEHIPDTGHEEIKAFLLKLAASGLLELGIGCSGVDPAWDIALQRFLLPHKKGRPAIAALYDLLILLAGEKDAYASAPAAQRHILLQQAAARLNDLFHQLQSEAGLPVTTALPGAEDTPPPAPAVFEVNRFAPRYFLPQDIFYEDACTPVQGRLPGAAIHHFTAKADRLYTLLSPLDTLREERQRMRDFFLQHYGQPQAVSVTDFYHAYYLQVKKQAQEKASTMPPILPDAISLTMDRTVVNLRAKNEVVTATGNEPLDLQDKTRLQSSSEPDGNARAMFVQFYQEAGALYGVINALLPGMGKVAGRFLHMFDPAVTNSFLEWNSALHPQHLQLELNDGSSFNANIHPPLLPYEIRMPGGNNNYPPERQVSVQSLQVRHNVQTGFLSLYHITTGQEVYAYDLCLESFYNRSHLYRLLAHFNPEQRPALRQLIIAVDEQYAAAFPQAHNAVVHKPRIVFEEHVIIRRQGWLIRTQDIPQLQAGETEADYFIRLHHWRVQLQLPEQVFLFLRSPYIPAAGSSGKLQRDDYKPQYCSFTHPLLAGLLRKLLSRAGDWCYFEEMLPHAKHLGADSTVTEQLLHWYNER